MKPMRCTRVERNSRILGEILRTSPAVRAATRELRAHFPVVWRKPLRTARRLAPKGVKR